MIFKGRRVDLFSCTDLACADKTDLLKEHNATCSTYRYYRLGTGPGTSGPDSRLLVLIAKELPTNAQRDALDDTLSSRTKRDAVSGRTDRSGPYLGKKRSLTHKVSSILGRLGFQLRKPSISVPRERPAPFWCRPQAIQSHPEKLKIANIGRISIVMRIVGYAGGPPSRKLSRRKFHENTWTATSRQLFSRVRCGRQTTVRGGP